MNFKIGDDVETLDDAIKGKVIEVAINEVKIEDEMGFQMTFRPEELILSHRHEDLDSAIDPSELEQIKRQDSVKSSQQPPRKKRNNKQNALFEVDLHIHQLTDSTKGMTNFDMLNLQLETAKRQLDFAIKKRIPKMVIIHGVGEGVLRQELYTLLRRYDNVEFYDADFKTYGFGATEVKIFQNIAP